MANDLRRLTQLGLLYAMEHPRDPADPLSYEFNLKLPMFPHLRCFLTYDFASGHPLGFHLRVQPFEAFLIKSAPGRIQGELADLLHDLAMQIGLAKEQEVLDGTIHAFWYRRQNAPDRTLQDTH